MNNSLTFGKRVLAVATAVATIVWALGAASLAVPQTAHAANAGDLITGTSLSTVYYMGHDGNRYVFPNEKTFDTWFSNFNDVQTMSDSDIAAIPLGGNVVYRPGSQWIKIQSDPKTYAVSTNGTIHWIESESVATSYAGSDWNQNIEDVPDVFFVDYSTGASLMSATAFDGMMYMDGADHVLAWDGEKRVVDSAGRTANRMQDRFFLDGTGIDDSSLNSGATISSNICDLTDAAQTGCTAVATGDLSVSLASSNPAGATVPQGANAVEVLTVDLTAGSSAAELDSLALDMTGVGATTNIANAYLYEGSTRLTDARTVNSSTRMATFSNLNLAFNANQTRTLTLRIEVSSSANAGDQIRFSVSQASDVTLEGSASASGSFPVDGNAFEIAGVSAGTIAVDKNGTIVNPTLGADDHTIGKFKLTANSEDGTLESIVLKVDNAGDHSDYKLWNGSTQLATGTDIGNKLVKFELTNALTIQDGGDEILSVTADVGGDASDTVGVYVDNKVDVVVTGADFGFGMTVGIASGDTPAGSYDGADTGSTSGTCNETGDDCSFSTVQGGDITIAFNGPSAGDIPTDSQDQTLFEFSITAENFVTIKDLDFIVVADDDENSDAFDVDDDSTDDDHGLINTNGEGNISDIKIVNTDTGSVIAGPNELDCVTTTCGADGTQDDRQTIDFTEDWSMNAGETLNLALRVDVDNDVPDSTEFGAIFDISGFVAEDSNGDTVASGDIIPSSDLNGFNQKATDSKLTVQLASSPVSTTVVQGTNNVDFLGVAFSAGDASPITITSLTFTGHGDDDDTSAMTAGGDTDFQIEDYLSSCSVYENGTLLDGPKSVETNGDVVFDTINWTVDAGAVGSLVLECNVSNPSDTDDDVFAFDILVTGDITAEDSDNNTPTITMVAAGSGDEGINDTNTADAIFDASVGITVTPSGSLAVTKGTGTPSADFLLTGTTGNHVSSFQFKATNEDFDVNTLTFSEEQAEDDTGTADSNAYANNIDKVSIEYPKADGTTGTKSVSMTGNEAKFSSLDMFAESGKTKTVKVMVDLPATDRDTGGSAQSNEKIRMAFKSDNADEFEAIGASSGVTKDGTNEASEGDEPFATDGIATHVVRETKPTVTLSSSSPSGTGNVPGDQEVFRFNVAAASGEDVVLDELIFKLSSSDNAGSDWNFCDQGGVGDGEIAESDLDFYNLSTDGTSQQVEGGDSDWTLLDSTGAACTDSTEETHFALLDLTTSEVVPAGTTYTYALYFDSTGASSSNDDSVQLSIENDPIVSSFLDSGVDLAADPSQTATALTADADVGDNGITVGDVLCVSDDTDCADATDERVLVVAEDGTTGLTVVRGYLGDVNIDHGGTENLLRLPSSFVWQDDGDTAITTGTEELWGAYLVDSLPVTGHALGF